MDFETRSKELTKIYDEYKLYFSECKLISSGEESGPNKLGNNWQDGYYGKSLSRAKATQMPKSNYIYIITGEGSELNVSVDISGWYTSYDQKHYETFEALMMDISPSFQSSFGNELSFKLNSLLASTGKEDEQ